MADKSVWLLKISIGQVGLSSDEKLYCLKQYEFVKVKMNVIKLSYL